MRKYLVSCLTLIVIGSPAFAQPKSKLAPETAKDAVVLDSWEVAYLEGNKAGFIHTVVRELMQEGGKVFNEPGGADGLAKVVCTAERQRHATDARFAGV